MMNKKLNVLLIGSGGREHALSQKILASKICNKVFAIPGNNLWNNVVSEINFDPNDNNKILNYIKDNNIDLTIIGPEDILKNGLSDVLIKNDHLVFAPTKKAAMIETSKDFSKKIMSKYNIPTAEYNSFSNFIESKNYIEKTTKFPIVIKSSNLAQGKGVLIAKNKLEAINYLDELLNKNIYGANNIAIIEEFLEGTEFSLMCLVNEDKIYPLPAVKDHKRVYDNDTGLNTGGMGVISDLPFLSEADIQKSISSCVKPLLEGLIKENIKYLGVVFAGIMKCKDNTFKVIEYNARWGDPETEIILQKMDCDILEFILAVLNKKNFNYNTINQKIAGIIVSAKNYPLQYNKNIDVSFLKNEKNIFYLGASSYDKKILSTSGRIFMIYDISEKDPSDIVYKRLEKLNLDKNKFHYRKDINWNKKK